MPFVSDAQMKFFHMCDNKPDGFQKCPPKKVIKEFILEEHKKNLEEKKINLNQENKP